MYISSVPNQTIMFDRVHLYYYFRLLSYNFFANQSYIYDT